jgi:hypothetical protein
MIELIAVDCTSDVKGIGVVTKHWLNERTNSNTVTEDVQRIICVGDALWFTDHISDRWINTLNVDEYEVRRSFVGTGWIYEHTYGAFAYVSTRTTAYFDDEMLALEFKLAAPWN